MSRSRGRRRGGQRPNLSAYQPPRISTKKDTEQAAGEASEDEQIEVFSIDDRVYYMDASLPPALGLRYLRNVRDRGYDAAVAEILTEALGEDGFNTLAECDDVKRPEMARIVDMVVGVALGAVDPGKGSSSEPSS